MEEGVIMQKFGSPEPIRTDPEDEQGVDADGISRQASSEVYDPAEIINEGTGDEGDI
jgi:hypothetical protein